MKRSLTSTAIVFFIVGIVLRLPFRSELLYHWDSINYALGIIEFDIINHQPQPPGYILYILLGRLFRLIFFDTNASLVWISVLFSGLTIATLYWTATKLFDDSVGVVAALLGLTSPLIWFYSEVALNYIIDAFFVSALAYACFRQLRGDTRFVLPAAILLGLAGGFRQTSLVFMFPLWLFSLKGVPWVKRITGTAVLTGVVLSWLATMILMSGGWDNFWLAMLSQSGYNLDNSSASSLQVLLLNLARLALFTFYGLMLASLVIPVSLIWFLRHVKQFARQSEYQVLFFWILPSLAFYTLYVQQAGHTLTYLPAVLIVIAYTLVKVIAPWLQSRLPFPRPAPILTNALVAVNVLFFLFATPYLFGINKFILRTPSANAITNRDKILSQKIDFIHQKFPPDQTLVLAGGMDFRIPDYYLPDYRLTFLSYDINRLTMDEIHQADTIRYIVMFNETSPYTGFSTEGFQTFLSADPLYWIELNSNDQLFLSKEGPDLKRNIIP